LAVGLEEEAATEARAAGWAEKEAEAKWVVGSAEAAAAARAAMVVRAAQAEATVVKEMEEAGWAAVGSELKTKRYSRQIEYQYRWPELEIEIKPLDTFGNHSWRQKHQYFRENRNE